MAKGLIGPVERMMALGVFLSVVFLTTMSLAADLSAVRAANGGECPPGGLWISETKTCVIEEWWLIGDDAVIEDGTIFDVSGTLRVDYYIIGPRGGTPLISSLDVYGTLHSRGDLVNLGTVINYGDMQTWGRVSIEWDSWTSCDWSTGRCVTIPIEGQIRNKGVMTNSGVMDVMESLVNEGRLTNEGTISAHRRLENHGEFVNDGNLAVTTSFFQNGGLLLNRGTYTASSWETITQGGTLSNTGRLVIQGRFHNVGTVFSSGDFRNEGELVNSGILSGGVISNSGTILNMGLISATITGEGAVIDMPYKAWLPQVYGP